MTIDEAIEYLGNYPIGASPDGDIEFQRAIQLGIEALKSVKRDRFDPSTYHPYPMPGETEK